MPAPEIEEPAGVLDRRLGVVHRARADHDQQPRVAPAQQRPDLLARAVDELRRRRGDGQDGLQAVRGPERLGVDDMQVVCRSHADLQKRKTPGHSRRPGARNLSELWTLYEVVLRRRVSAGQKVEPIKESARHQGDCRDSASARRTHAKKLTPRPPRSGSRGTLERRGHAKRAIGQGSLLRLRRGSSRRRRPRQRVRRWRRIERRGQARHRRPHDERPSGHLGQRRRRRLGRRRLRHDRALRRARVEVLRERGQGEPHGRLGHRPERRLGLGIRGKRPPLGRHGLEGRLPGHRHDAARYLGRVPDQRLGRGRRLRRVAHRRRVGIREALDGHGVVRLRRARRQYALEGLGLRPGRHLARRNLGEHDGHHLPGNRYELRSARLHGRCAPGSLGKRPRRRVGRAGERGAAALGRIQVVVRAAASPRGRDGTASAAAGPTTSGPSATTE